VRRTRIVATLGPASRDAETLPALLETGVDAVRLNAAHDVAATHAATAAAAREAAARLGRAVGVLVDLPGPKMRTGAVVDDEVELEPGRRLVLGPVEGPGNAERMATTVADLAAIATPGEEIFLADGAIVLTVTDVDGDDVGTEVLRGGALRSRKGMFLPGAEHRVPSFTAADAAALELAIGIGADFVGLSFVRSAADIRDVRSRLPREGARPQLVAKIETRAALGDLMAIVDAADAIMVARGDLGIQVELARVALLQKEIVQVCNNAGKPVITATQLLESMTRAPLPTRAEVTDVANAVLDGTDALMLSEETAVGAYPLQTVRTMADVAVAAEGWPRNRLTPAAAISGTDAVAWAVAHAAVAAAEDVGVAAILCPTRTGATPRRVSAFRPRVPVVAVAHDPAVRAGLALTWGVGCCTAAERDLENDPIDAATTAARAAGFVEPGRLVAVVAGAPGTGLGATDTVRVLRA
jgi:pyruvate kinase